MFLDPYDHLPLFGGTHFPRERRGGMPGFGEVLTGIRQVFEYRDARIGTFRDQVHTALFESLGKLAAGEPDMKRANSTCGISSR